MDPLKSFNSNKHLKEEFVSNLSGSSVLEIIALTITVPMLVLIRHSTSATGAFLKKKNDDAVSKSSNFKAYLSTLSLDFIIIVVPMLLCFTIMLLAWIESFLSIIFQESKLIFHSACVFSVKGKSDIRGRLFIFNLKLRSRLISVLSNWTYIFTILLMLLTFVCIAAKRTAASSISIKGEHNSIREYITSYRVVVMIITFLCILAVDFRIFPRRYAKTETYGTSLMDLGVGSFVLANALVSRQARNITSVNWKTAIVSISPLITLGFLRLVTTTGVDYQVHVSEYGVHWNFFFTLAAVSILTSFVNVPPQYSGIFGLLVLFCLIHGLSAYLLSDERGMDIISQNKEGIHRYWGMYLVGVQLGNYLIFGSHSSGLRSTKWVQIRVWILSICNLPYVTSVLADNLQLLSILMLGDLIPGSKTSVLEEALNRNLLATFLLANILTGLVNLSVDTLSASSITALSVLLGYAYILSTAIGTADYFGVKLKFW
ncbi:hypothetical protein Ahy_A09g045469 isoform A [Arachis hypogaea]|uniref:GPI-anchored wall transfer protein n=1 Tax=Arachis hypogaea TaxID=3818 RepID=A0A445BMD4_ARAHY|nr:hypothetical protein Ahy_A09g045469 isoform A [Arachis hypogaea]